MTIINLIVYFLFIDHFPQLCFEGKWLQNRLRADKNESRSLLAVDIQGHQRGGFCIVPPYTYLRCMYCLPSCILITKLVNLNHMKFEILFVLQGPLKSLVVGSRKFQPRFHVAHAGGLEVRS